MELIDNKFMPKLEKVDINKLYEIFNDNDVNEYLNYLGLMDTLGLPTCDEMTDIVLG